MEVNMTDVTSLIESVKEHIDEKFINHDLVESVRHERINELLEQYGKHIENNNDRVTEVHGRVSRIETKIKTVTGLGTAIATGAGMVLAWLGLHR